MTWYRKNRTTNPLEIFRSIFLKANASQTATPFQVPPVLAKLAKEPARTDTDLIAPNTGRWELEVTASTAARTGRRSTASAFACPQDIRILVTCLWAAGS